MDHSFFVFYLFLFFCFFGTQFGADVDIHEMCSFELEIGNRLQFEFFTGRKTLRRGDPFWIRHRTMDIEVMDLPEGTQDILCPESFGFESNLI